MSKNYFTDEQIDNVIKETFNLDSIPEKCTDYVINAEQLKSLMNLAVEAVIGEKVGFLIKHFDGEYELDFNETWQKVKEQLPLYSVKELEN